MSHVVIHYLIIQQKRKRIILLCWNFMHWVFVCCSNKNINIDNNDIFMIEWDIRAPMVWVFCCGIGDRSPCGITVYGKLYVPFPSKIKGIEGGSFFGSPHVKYLGLEKSSLQIPKPLWITQNPPLNNLWSHL